MKKHTKAVAALFDIIEDYGENEALLSIICLLRMYGIVKTREAKKMADLIPSEFDNERTNEMRQVLDSFYQHCSKPGPRPERLSFFLNDWYGESVPYEDESKQDFSLIKNFVVRITIASIFNGCKAGNLAELARTAWALREAGIINARMNGPAIHMLLSFLPLDKLHRVDETPKGKKAFSKAFNKIENQDTPPPTKDYIEFVKFKFERGLTEEYWGLPDGYFSSTEPFPLAEYRHRPKGNEEFEKYVKYRRNPRDEEE